MTHDPLAVFYAALQASYAGSSDFDPKAEQSEVAEVFSVPLWHVLNRQNFMIQSRRWRGKRRHYYTVPYGPYYIWGATACILRRMIG